MTVGLTLGAPGIYLDATPPPPSPVQPVRLDATGFVGLAWRGPVNTPMAVTSWSQFVEVFGGVTAVIDTWSQEGLLLDQQVMSCPGYLPRAVRAFFDQGGATAWVCRVAPTTDPTAATTRFTLPDGRRLTAADEGSWGDRLQLSLGFEPGPPLPRGPMAVAASVGRAELAIDDDATLPPGSLIRVTSPARTPSGSLHWTTAQQLRPLPGGGRLRVLTLDPPLPEGISSRTADAHEVLAVLEVFDPDPLRRRSERIGGLGLHPEHPAYPARPLPPGHPGYPGTVLSQNSRLVRTGAGWDDAIEPGDAGLTPWPGKRVGTGRDRFADVDDRSFFDDDSPDGDPLQERSDHRGVDRIGQVVDLGLLCVPDLAWSSRRHHAITPRWQVGEAGEAGHLDPRDGQALTELATRQRRSVAVAEHRGVVALLDAPSKLAPSALIRWRAGFDSSYAAAYYPWLGVPGDDPLRRAVPLPPSAVAAGIIAARERRLGLPWGPANELAVGVVIADDPVPDAVHDDLHRSGVNVFRAERDGFRLTAARTLSAEAAYRQLSVRRLMTMLIRSLDREGEVLVFEPHTADLRVQTTHRLTQFLRSLFQAGAFAGDDEASSFFVHCDDRLNPPESVALGRLVTEVGVAPSRPLEYLVLRLSQDIDGTRIVTAATASGIRSAVTR